MADGTKLAIAIMVIWVALVFMFFAFHPGGVTGVSNPGQMLKWLMDEFTKLAGAGDTSSTSSTDQLPGTTTTPASQSSGGTTVA